MSRVTLSLLLSLTIGAISSVSHAGDSNDQGLQLPKLAKTLIAFSSLYGVDGGFVGTNNPQRGVAGDDLPWDSPSFAEGRVTTDGLVFITVRGLVLGHDDVVPDNLKGVNPDATFRGRVSCMTEVGETDVAEAHVDTREFKANAHGDSTILEKVTLPNPCVAPVVMILNGKTDQWFAMTGVEN